MGRANMNPYFVKAFETYPYNLEEAYEALNYALSAEEDLAGVYFVYGAIEIEYFKRYDKAITYFEQVLLHDTDFVMVYEPFIHACMQLNRNEQAQKLIDFAKQINGVDKVGMGLLQATFLERNLAFKEAKKMLEDLKLHIVCDGVMEKVDAQLARVKLKMQWANPEKKTKKGKKKVK